MVTAAQAETARQPARMDATLNRTLFVMNVLWLRERKFQPRCSTVDFTDRSKHLAKLRFRIRLIISRKRSQPSSGFSVWRPRIRRCEKIVTAPIEGGSELPHLKAAFGVRKLACALFSGSNRRSFFT